MTTLEASVCLDKQRPVESLFWKRFQQYGDPLLALESGFLFHEIPVPEVLLVLFFLLAVRTALGPRTGLAISHLLIIWILSAFIAPCRGSRPQGYLTSCKSNLKSLGTACERYSVDHEGHYPATLQQLTPKYMKAIPNCPMAERDSYSEGYVRSRVPHAYTICCSGIHHKNTGITLEGYPSYNNRTGLTER